MFIELLQFASKIIVSDADLDNPGMHFVNTISKNMSILINTYPEPQKTFTMINSETKYMNAIIQDIKDNKNVCVGSLSKDFALHLRDRLHTEFPDLKEKIMCLHSDCDNTLKNELKNINTNWLKYRVVIYSPIAGCGLNFDRKHMHKQYGYIEVSIGDPNMFIQILGRVRIIGDMNITVLVAPKMNTNIDAQLYSLEYAEKHYESSIHKDYEDSRIFYHKDGNLCSMTAQAQSLWNKMRGYYLQSNELNNTNYNYLTMFKIVVERKGHIFKTQFDEIIKEKRVMKKQIDRILEVTSVSNAEYGKLAKKALNINNNVTENEKLVMLKVDMRQDLCLKEKTDEKTLNECLKLYDDNKEIIETVLNNYNEGDIDDDDNASCDSYVESKNKYLSSAFEKVVKALGCEFMDEEEITYEQDNFDKRIKKLNFTENEKKSLNSRGKCEDKIRIVKMVLERFGFIVKSYGKQKRVDGKITYIRKYEISYDKDIYNIIYCRFFKKKKENNYSQKFVDFIKKFPKYNDFIEVEVKKISKTKKRIIPLSNKMKKCNK
jgi:hypothetical protein